MIPQQSAFHAQGVSRPRRNRRPNVSRFLSDRQFMAQIRQKLDERDTFVVRTLVKISVP